MKEKIVDLFPEFSEQEQRIAAENLDRYLELAWEIWEENQSRDG
jgi:hypothetical protein